MGFRWASEAARKGTGTFSRGLGRRWVGIFSGGIGVGGGKMSQSPGLWRMGVEWVPVGARGARFVVSTAICERVRRWPRVSPLPRDPLCPTQATSSRGRGRGWGSIELSFPTRARERFRHRQRDPSSALRAPCIFQKGSKTASPRGAGFVGGRIGEGTSRPDRLWALAPVLACRVGFGQRSQTANCGCRSSTRDQAACRAGGRKVLSRAGQTRPASTRLTRWGDAAIAWGAPDWSCFGGPVTRWSGASLNP